MSTASRMTTFQTTYQRPTTYAPAYPIPRPIPDDYEKWYTEPAPNNRMLLSLCSGIQKEIDWALERMCRLSHNDQFILRNIPGLADALVEWPEWYVEKGFEECQRTTIFSLSQATARRRRHALEATFILRNASLNEPNAQYLTAHRRTLILLRKALNTIKPDSDTEAEFMLHIVDLLHSVALCVHQQLLQLQQLALQQQQLSQQQQLQQQQLIQTAFKYLMTETLIGPLEELTASSNDRTMIITALRTLTLIISFAQNAIYITSTSPALSVAIRYLPLLDDTALITPCLDYLYAHLSHPPMVKAFLHNPNMPGTLKLLVILLLREQQEEMATLDLIHEPIRTAPAVVALRRQCELTEEEFERISKISEPERSYEWMRALFVASDAEEVTQVEFWNLYRDKFGPKQDVQPILSAAEVIKNVPHVFPTAQAMVLPGQPQRFVIKGITRKMMDITEERFRCQWDRSVCTSVNFQTVNELWEHVAQHISTSSEDTSCRWRTCQFSTAEQANLLRHVATHLPPPTPPSRHSSQLENVTLPIEPWPHPSANPTARPPPPPPNPQVVYPYPSTDPPSTSLTALLILRVLFRASFAANDAAPRADGDHFGFPGIVEEDSDDENQDKEEEYIRGQERGRRAFTGVRKLLENVRVRDTALMEWIGEILDVSLEEKPANV